jgi:arylsulfatase A-like enzyme
VSGSAGWHPLRVDLGAFAGRDAVLRIRLGGRAGAVGFLASPRVSGAPARRLNVLMVVEDTLRADHLGAWGHARATSPVKDHLAKEGVVFTRAISQATKTRPSVPSYMTGLYPATTGVWDFHDRLPPAFVTLAEILRSQGFETGSFVQNTNAGPAAGLHQGFDRTLSQRVAGVRPQDVYGDLVLDWWAARRDRNVFAYVHVLDPHGTYDPPEPYDAWYRSLGRGTPVERDPRLDPPGVEHPTVEGRRLRYDGEIAHNDARFTALLEGLRSLGVLDDTLIVFFSDHGEHQGEHGVWEHAPPGFLPVLHVPLLLWLPEVLPGGARVEAPVELIDVVPTVLELAGIAPDDLVLQGRSLLALLGDETPPPVPVLSEEAISYRRDRPGRVRGSVFHGPWHLLYTRHRDQKRLRVFDLADDPNETRSALPWLRLDPFLEPRVLRSLRRVKAANLALGGTYGRVERRTVELDPEAREQLRALGYIE